MELYPHQGGSMEDAIASKLQSIAHNILVVVFGLLPIFFLPFQAAPLDHTKTLFAIAGIFVALIFFSLSVLRSGKVSFGAPYALIALWVVGVVALLSALLSGDIRDALIGTSLGVHTAAFVGLLALTATVWVLFGIKKESVMRLFMFLVGSTVVLVVFHVLRLFAGAGKLSLGVFQNNVATPLGGWNDLALFLGLVILLALVTLEQLPLTKHGRWLFGGVTVAALIMLAVINFFFVWIVLGLVSLVMLVYTLGRERLSGKTVEQNQLIPSAQRSFASLVIPIVVFIVSALFVVGGTMLGNVISSKTGISYIEVRPSIAATADIARSVYKENAFLGIGTNRFTDAWRMYKDTSINSTVFWNTNFQAGNGYIPTFFVTNGVLGALAWIVFLVLFVMTGLRMLFSPNEGDRMWYFIGTASFVGAIYIWGMSIVYIPGSAVLLLAALFTGITFAASRALNVTRTYTLTLGANRRTGFLLTLVVMAVIIGSVGSLYAAGRNYMAEYTFDQSILSAKPGASLDSIEAEVANAFQLSKNAIYARRIAQYQLARMNTLLQVQSPTDAQKQQFQAAIANGVNAARLATQLDGSDPDNWSVLGDIYAVLVVAKVDKAYDYAKEALTKAQELDPKNPLRDLELAVLEARNGSLDNAQKLTEQAIGKKSNYADALYFLSQLQIAKGDVKAAIQSTQSIISLDPQNPQRYYQLGVLESANKDTDAAISAFEQAVNLDPNFANARYFLALAYSEKGRPQDAKSQLEKVAELNPDNAQVKALIQQLDANGSISTPTQTSAAQPVSEQQAVSQTAGEVTTNKAPDTGLVSPVNTPPAENAPSDASAQTQQTTDTGTTASSDSAPAGTSTGQ